MQEVRNKVEAENQKLEKGGHLFHTNWCFEILFCACLPAAYSRQFTKLLKVVLDTDWYCEATINWLNFWEENKTSIIRPISTHYLLRFSCVTLAFKIELNRKFEYHCCKITFEITMLPGLLSIDLQKSVWFSFLLILAMHSNNSVAFACSRCVFIEFENSCSFEYFLNSLQGKSWLSYNSLEVLVEFNSFHRDIQKLNVRCTWAPIDSEIALTVKLRTVPKRPHTDTWTGRYCAFQMYSFLMLSAVRYIW